MSPLFRANIQQERIRLEYTSSKRIWRTHLEDFEFQRVDLDAHRLSYASYKPSLWPTSSSSWHVGGAEETMSGSPFTFFFSRFGASSSSVRIIAASARHESLEGRRAACVALGITNNHFLFVSFPTRLTTANATRDAHF